MTRMWLQVGLLLAVGVYVAGLLAVEWENRKYW